MTNHRRPGSIDITYFVSFHRHILGWRNPAETLVIAGSCVMGIIGVQYLSRGGLGITLVEGIAYFMLIKLAIGFMSSTLGAAAPGGAKLWDTTIDNVAGALRAAAQVKGDPTRT